MDVDCKWSLNLYDWEIPQEMYSRGDKIALVVWANEYTARWAAGLIRISERSCGRRDANVTANAASTNAAATASCGYRPGETSSRTPCCTSRTPTSSN